MLNVDAANVFFKMVRFLKEKLRNGGSSKDGMKKTPGEKAAESNSVDWRTAGFANNGEYRHSVFGNISQNMNSRESSNLTEPSSAGGTNNTQALFSSGECQLNRYNSSYTFNDS